MKVLDSGTRQLAFLEWNVLLSCPQAQLALCAAILHCFDDQMTVLKMAIGEFFHPVSWTSFMACSFLLVFALRETLSLPQGFFSVFYLILNLILLSNPSSPPTSPPYFLSLAIGCHYLISYSAPKPYTLLILLSSIYYHYLNPPPSPLSFHYS